MIRILNRCRFRKWLRNLWITLIGLSVAVCAVAASLTANQTQSAALQASQATATPKKQLQLTLAPTSRTPAPTEQATDTMEVLIETPASVQPTATSASRATLAVSRTLTPTPTASVTQTVKVTVTAKPPTDLPVLVGTGVMITITSGGVAQGNGRLSIQLRDAVGKPIRDANFRIFSQKKDLTNKPVVDKEFKNGSTNESGVLALDLPPGKYTVGTDLPGYNWGNAREVRGQADVPVEGGKVTSMTLSLSQIDVGLLRADNSIVHDQFIRVFTQRKDLAGNWVTDKEVTNGSTDNTGAIRFNLTPGYYIVQMDLRGYNWGTAKDVLGQASTAAKLGEVTKSIVSLGRIVVGLTRPEGGVTADKYVRIFTQKLDASKKLVVDREVVNGGTSNRGFISFDLTPGKYAVAIDDRVQFDVPVEASKITFSDGLDFEFRSPDEPLTDAMVNDLLQLQGTGVKVGLSSSNTTKSDQGRLSISVRSGQGEPVMDAFFRVYMQRTDLVGNPVLEREIKNGSTDNTGRLQFDLPPGKYTVSADFRGYGWGDAREVKGEADAQVEAGKETQLDISQGSLKIGVIRADGTVVADQFVRVWEQAQDLSGEWVRIGEVANGGTDNTGAVSFGLSPGYYFVETDLRGYNWGNAQGTDGKVSMPVKPGEETTIIISLGQLQVGLLNSDKQPQIGKYVQVFTQKPDQSDNPVLDQEVVNGSTDNTGTISFHLTPGKYAVKVDDRITFDIVLEAGKVTETDGTQFRVHGE